MSNIFAEKKSDNTSRPVTSKNIGDTSSRMAAVPALQRKEAPQEELQMKATQLKNDTLQKKVLGDEEESPIQGKFTIQKQGGPEEDPLQKKPFQLKSDTVQKAGLPEEETLQKKSFQLKIDPVQKVSPFEERLPAQGKFQAVQKKKNTTGLPDNLKSGVENLSGFSMDDVKVHYNSFQPAQLNALAYAQGTEIHVAPGQEKHLPHEAWHVAQQKQGRVQPTMQMKAGVPVNDDPGLENEADVMGTKAMQMEQINLHSINNNSTVITKAIQRYPISKVNSTQVSADSGRPSAKSNKGTIEGIIGRIYQIGPMNDLETILKNLNNKATAVNEVYANNFLSNNGAAICHKHAIDVFEEQFVAYANQVLNKTNSSTHDQQAIQLVMDLTQLDKSKQSTCLTYLKNVKDIHVNSGLFSDQASDVANYLTYLINELDGSHSNLYIGYARTNSSIQRHFDPHYDVNSTTDPNASPVSTSIYESQKVFGDGLGVGHASPRRVIDSTGSWNETSGVPNKGWIIYDHNKNQYL